MHNAQCSTVGVIVEQHINCDTAPHCTNWTGNNYPTKKSNCFRHLQPLLVLTKHILSVIEPMTRTQPNWTEPIVSPNRQRIQLFWHLWFLCRMAKTVGFLVGQTVFSIHKEPNCFWHPWKHILSLSHICWGNKSILLNHSFQRRRKNHQNENLILCDNTLIWISHVKDYLEGSCNISMGNKQFCSVHTCCSF